MFSSNVPPSKYLDERMKILFQLRLSEQSNLVSILPPELVFEIVNTFYQEMVRVENENISEVYYIDFENQRNGPYNKFMGDVLIETGEYKDGKENGEWRTYYASGQLKAINSYVDGKKNGEWRTYYERGDLETIINYIDDKKNGLYEFHYTRNDMEDNIDEDDDTILYITRGNYVDDKKDGKWYSFSGEIIIHVNSYKNNLLNGESLYYYPDGRNVQRVNNYKDGKKYGEQKNYDIDGSIYTIDDYKEDDLMERKSFNKRGNLLKIETYINGRKHGKEIIYNLDGTIKSEKEYEMGVLINSSQ